MDNVTRIIVKRRYLPSRGIARDVGGIISAKRRKNTVRERRMEIHRVTCKNISYTADFSSYLLLFDVCREFGLAHVCQEL